MHPTNKVQGLNHFLLVLSDSLAYFSIRFEAHLLAPTKNELREQRCTFHLGNVQNLNYSVVVLPGFKSNFVNQTECFGLQGQHSRIYNGAFHKAYFFDNWRKQGSEAKSLCCDLKSDFFQNQFERIHVSLV